MLLVAGTAALTAIAVYLVWHFFRKWRVATRRRKAEARVAIADARREEERARGPRELHPV